MSARVLGGILVGGRSRRMGRPKQLIEIGDRTMIEKVADSLSREVDEVLLLGNGPVPASLDDLSRVTDADGCRGPMAGILGALRARPGACWIVTPCDLPLLEPAAINWLLDQRQSHAAAVLPSIDGFVEPLLALYEPQARTILEQAAAAGKHALHRLTSRSGVVTATPPAALRRCWFNANTPQELMSLSAG